MRTKLSFFEFQRAFADAGRGGDFSQLGLKILFEHVEEYEQSCGHAIGQYVIELCQAYVESRWQDVAANHLIDVDMSACQTDKNRIDLVRDYLIKNTLLCGEHSDLVFVYARFNQQESEL